MKRSRDKQMLSVPLVTHRGQVRVVSVTARKEKMQRGKEVVERMKAGAPKKPVSGSSGSGNVGYGFPSRPFN